MRYTIAERELLDGLSARNAATARGFARDSAYADAYYEGPTPTPYAFPSSRPIACDFDERGRVRASWVDRQEVVMWRRGAHEGWVYPECREDAPGLVYTEISAWGGSRDQEEVSVDEYIRRYRLWCLRHGAGPRHRVTQRDRQVIEARLGTALRRVHWFWRVFWFA